MDKILPTLLGTLRLGASVTAGAFVLLFFPVFLAALSWTVLAETAAGFFAALFFISWYLATGYLQRTLYIYRSKALKISGCLYTASLFFLFWTWMCSPTGKTSSMSGLHSFYPASQKFKRLALANLVPEIDQVKVGTYVAGLLDPHMDHLRAARVRTLSLRHYRELERDAGFREAGSVMPSVYADILGHSFRSNHLYVYTPSGERKRPVILFLHGSMGNFKGHLWIWKKFADEHDLAIVAPSFGQGNWYEEGGMATIEKAMDFIKKDPLLNEDQIILAGLSNGGTGVTRITSLHPEKFRGIILLSAVIESDQLSGLRNQKVLVLHGSEDERVTMKHTFSGWDIRLYPKEDHFLFYSQDEKVRQDMGQWLTSSAVLIR